MQVTADLRLSFPVRWGERPDPQDATRTVSVPLIWAYHTPISREVFQQYWRVIAATKDTLLAKGTRFAFNEGPQIASLAFQDAAKADAAEYGTTDMGAALLADLRRLTMVLAPTPQGNEMLMADAAIARGVLSVDDWAEAESALIFFTSFYAMARRQEQGRKAEAAALALMGSITSLSLSEWAASFQTSTTAEDSPAPVEQTIPQ